MKSFDEIMIPITEFYHFLYAIENQDNSEILYDLFNEYKMKYCNAPSLIADIEDFLSNKKNIQYFVNEIIKKIDKIYIILENTKIPGWVAEAINRDFINMFICFNNVSDYLKENYLNIKPKNEMPKYHLVNMVYKKYIEIVKVIAFNEFGPLTDIWNVIKRKRQNLENYVAFIQAINELEYYKNKKLTLIERDQIIQHTFSIKSRQFQNNNYSYPELQEYYKKLLTKNTNK